MESHGTVCEWDGDKLTAWISTQGISAARENFASALGIPQSNVRVICQYMGGGFGSKAMSVGAEIHELSVERPDLENVFLQLTAGKAEIR